VSNKLAPSFGLEIHFQRWGREVKRVMKTLFGEHRVLEAPIHTILFVARPDKQ